jgi:hypothetical protein
MKRVVLKAIKGRKKKDLPNGRNTDSTGPNNARRFRQHVRTMNPILSESTILESPPTHKALRLTGAHMPF